MKLILRTKVFRQHNNWLRYQTENKLSKLYAELLSIASKKKRSDKIDKILSLGSGYYSIVLSVLFFISCAFLSMLTGICVNDYAAFIDQRSSNLATISGMCLAVIAFLMSNIAIKEPYAYRVVFTSTKMYAAIIFVLSSLSCFVIVSGLRETIPAQYYGYFAMSSLFVFVAVLVVIGYIFSKAIGFTNSERIDAFMVTELSKNAAQILVEGLLRKHSLERYFEIMQQHGATRYAVSEHFERAWLYATKDTNEEKTPERNIKISFVQDIDLIDLANFVESRTKPVYFHDLHLNLETSLSDEYVFNTEKELTLSERDTLRNLLRRVHKEPKFPIVVNIRRHFDEKLVEHSKNGKHKELSRILDGIGTLYDLQATYGLSQPFDLTVGFSAVLKDALKISVKENSSTCFQVLIRFFYNRSNTAISSKDIDSFKQFIGLHTFVYLMAIPKKDDSEYVDILTLALDGTGYYDQYFYPISKMEQNGEGKTLIAQELAELTYTNYSMLMYYMVLYKDVLGLKSTVKRLEAQFGAYADFNLKYEISDLKNAPDASANYKKIKQLKIEYRSSKQIQTYGRHAMFGVKAWLYHLLRNAKWSADEVFAITKRMPIRYTDMEDALEDIFWFRSGKAIFSSFGWTGWTFRDDEEDEPVISDPIEWLTFAFMAEQIVQFHLPMFTGELDYEDFQYIEPLKDKLIAIKAYLLNNFIQWKEILGLESELDLENKAQRVVDFFDRLQTEQEIDALKGIAEAAIDEAIVADQSERAFKSWKEQTHIYRFFEERGNVVQTASNLRFIGVDRYFSDYKRFFIEGGQDLQVLGTFGSAMGRQVDDLFFNTATQQVDLDGDKISDILTGGILLLQSRLVVPDCIMIERQNRFTDESLFGHEDFRKNPLAPVNNTFPKQIGWFKDIPVYLFNNSSLVNKIIISDFREAFEMIFTKVNGAFEDTFEVQVRQVTVGDSEGILAARNGHNDADRQRKLWEIQNGIFLKLGARIEFRVVDTKAYVVGSIAENGALSMVDPNNNLTLR